MKSDYWKAPIWIAILGLFVIVFVITDALKDHNRDYKELRAIVMQEIAQPFDAQP